MPPSHQQYLVLSVVQFFEGFSQTISHWDDFKAELDCSPKGVHNFYLISFNLNLLTESAFRTFVLDVGWISWLEGD